MKASPGSVLVVDTTPAGEAFGCNTITARQIDHARARTAAALGRVGDTGGRCGRLADDVLPLEAAVRE